MLSRNQAKHIQSLKLAKFRQQHRQFLAEGVKLAGELLESSYEILDIFALKPWIEANSKLITRKGLSAHEITEDELGRISQLVTPNEVLLIARIPDIESTPAVDDLVLFLDRIQDPGNLGTILRTADWFGIRTVVCSPGCADLYNPKVVQATMGSITRVKVVHEEATSFLGRIKGNATIFGAMADGEDIYSLEIKEPAVLVIGNESKGISDEVTPLLDFRAAIPRYSEKAESLNASMATAILCSEFRRRRDHA